MPDPAHCNCGGNSGRLPPWKDYPASLPAGWRLLDAQAGEVFRPGDRWFYWSPGSNILWVDPLRRTEPFVSTGSGTVRWSAPQDSTDYSSKDLPEEYRSVPAPTWRILRPGETILFGDEFSFSAKSPWGPASTAGYTVPENSSLRWRRRIDPVVAPVGPAAVPAAAVWRELQENDVVLSGDEFTSSLDASLQAVSPDGGWGPSEICSHWTGTTLGARRRVRWRRKFPASVTEFTPDEWLQQQLDRLEQNVDQLSKLVGRLDNAGGAVRGGNPIGQL